MKKVDEKQTWISILDGDESQAYCEFKRIRAHNYSVLVQGHISEDSDRSEVRRKVDGLSDQLQEFLNADDAYTDLIESKVTIQGLEWDLKEADEEIERLKGEVKNFKFYNLTQLIGACLAGGVLLAGLQYGWQLLALNGFFK